MIHEKKSLKTHIKDYIVITIASFFYGLAISQFLDPNDIAPGGVSGLSMIINRIINIEVGTIILMINIPILLLGLYKFGLKFLISTIYATVMGSVFTNILAVYPPVTTDPLLATIGGSAVASVAIGCIFKSGATTGGTDIIVKVLRLKFPHLKTGRLFLMCDLVVVLLSAFVFEDTDSALYAVIGVFLMSVVFDIVLYGADGAKLIYIISNEWQAIATRLLMELDVGVTYLEGEGAYSNEHKRVIMCVVRKQIAPQVEEVVKEEDGNAFMIVSSAAEIYGEGYKNIYSEKI